MTKIRFTRDIANRKRGAVAEYDDATARSLIAVGVAEEYADPGPPGDDDPPSSGDAGQQDESAEATRVTRRRR